MKKLAYVLLFSVVALTYSCNQANKADKKTNTGTSQDADHSQHEQMAVEGGSEITACNHQTKIFWTGSKPTGEHNGYIKIKEGNYIVKDGQLVGGEFIIDMNSIVDKDIEDEEMNNKLVGHLKSADFFHVDSFPTGKFVITNVAAIDDESYNKKITGNLTLKGITKEVSFKATVKVNDGNVVAKSEVFTLDRTDWNVNYGSKSIFKELKDKFIHDEFTLEINAYSM
jgi:hypothetical protein